MFPSTSADCLRQIRTGCIELFPDVIRRAHSTIDHDTARRASIPKTDERKHNRSELTYKLPGCRKVRDCSRQGIAAISSSPVPTTVAKCSTKSCKSSPPARPDVKPNSSANSSGSNCRKFCDDTFRVGCNHLSKAARWRIAALKFSCGTDVSSLANASCWRRMHFSRVARRLAAVREGLSNSLAKPIEAKQQSAEQHGCEERVLDPQGARHHARSAHRSTPNHCSIKPTP
mmetsp:Transcript_32167/g.74153  ORF Transcript_32167/g.74153 Transcript_32167/m.74153 type:complete len:230 (-) Transcript_32167:13-702(-)